VVLGAKVPGLSEVGDVAPGGQLYNVFRVRRGRIVEVVDYARRDEAITAAGAQAPAWQSRSRGWLSGDYFCLTAEMSSEMFTLSPTSTLPLPSA
jgi:hypothetical protein